MSSEQLAPAGAPFRHETLRDFCRALGAGSRGSPEGIPDLHNTTAPGDEIQRDSHDQRVCTTNAPVMGPLHL